MAARSTARLSVREGRRFAWTLGVGFGVLAALTLGRGRGTLGVVLAALAVLALVAGVAAPTRLGPAARAWQRLGDAIGVVTRPVVLAVLYWLVLTPMGLVRRLATRSPIVRSRTAASYWVAREPVAADAARRGMERMF